MKKDIIVVAYHMGRIGSSTMMGLLNLAGINVGKEELLSGPSIMNPKGFFETKKQNSFLSNVYDGYYPGFTSPPDIDLVRGLGKKYYTDYYNLINYIYSGKYPIALKSQRFLTIPFLYELQDSYNLKIIKLTRNIDDQVRSIERVWAKNGNLTQKKADYNSIKNWIQEWGNFSENLMNSYNLNSIDVSFEEIVNNPVQSVEYIFSNLNLTPPKEKDVSDWVDLNLVNRKSL